jgi:glycerol-3-phosphate O-acyltransferase
LTVGRADTARIRGDIRARPTVGAELEAIAQASGRSASDVGSEFDDDLTEMVASQGGVFGDTFVHLARLFDRSSYRDRVRYNRAQVRQLARLADRFPIAVLPSHRSYLDPIVLAAVLRREGIAPTYKLGGINVSFWPMGPLGRRAGLIFIRRSFRDDPIYKLALREYIGWLAEHRANLEWYIEGGRTRTGKLREPRLGLLSYLVGAVRARRTDDFLLLPASIVYDELLDVEEQAEYARGGHKRPETFARLVEYVRSQRERYARGDIFISFAEPISLREFVDAGTRPLEQLGFEVARRINAVTPITPPALATMALLWADRALTLDQLLVVMDSYARDVERRDLPVTSVPLVSRATLTSGLLTLERHGVVTRFDRGPDVVFAIAPEQRITASYYRNQILHFFVVPAIVDLAAAAETGDLHTEALRVRDILKFEFFFPERDEFLAAVDAEWKQTDRPIMAPMLRPFLEAYWATGDELVSRGDAPVSNEDELRASARARAEQYVLQQRAYCADAASNSYLDGALRLVAHRGLLTGTDLASRRVEYAEELHTLVRRVRTTQAWAARRFLDVLRGATP